jgi:hypothetical protein
MKTNLQKLQRLCDIVNKRYKNELNDDDQVKRMFEFREKHTDELQIIIGWDTYNASLKESKESPDTIRENKFELKD